MTQDRPTLARYELRTGLLRAVAIVAAVIAIMAAASAVLGFGGPVPGFELTPDPAGAMPF